VTEAQTPDPLFVLGVPRSGTTLLRVMLAGHPQLFSPPEMVLAPFENMAQRRQKLEERFWEKGGLRRTLMELNGASIEEAKIQEDSLGSMTIPEVYQWLQARLGQRLLVDKCPHLAAEPEALERLAAWFPNARWLWIVRHPGSVIRSLENMPMAEVMLQGYGGDARMIWTQGNLNFRDFLKKIPADRQLMLRYEDIVANPEGPMRAFCERFGLPFAEGMTNPYEGEKMREGPKGARAVGDPNMAGRGRIDPELATAWLEGFDVRTLSEQTRSLAAELGYDLSQLGLPPVASVDEALQKLWESSGKLLADLKMPQDIDAVEARRFLLRVTALAIDTWVEWADPELPHFEHSEGTTRKTFGDNPDADYLRAPVRMGPGRVYRVRGHIPPGTTYVGMLLYRRGGVVGNRLRDIDFVKENGDFEVLVSTEPQDQPGTAYLKADGDETAVMIRQYYTDRRTQPPIRVEIERIGASGLPAPLDARELARGVERARKQVEATFKRTLDTWKMASAMALNRFMTIDAETLFPTPDNRYQACWYRFGRDQVMLVRGRLPKGRYVAFTLYNAWLESLDYQHRSVHRNHTRLELQGEDVEICLAHHDPGHPNWLDTAGHLAGYLVVRTLLPAEDETPPFTIQVMYEKEWEAEKLRRAAR
jgi:Sulfotransferase family